MTPKLSHELREALQLQPAGEPLSVLDEETQRVYFLLDPQAAREFAVFTLRRELQPAIDQADRGELQPWDVEEIIAEGERQVIARKPQA
jgi:hypothetical protein